MIGGARIPADYDRLGVSYGRFRHADPRIARRIEAALGDAVTIVNVGSGTGSYEPADRRVFSVEPSTTMIAQRSRGSERVVRALAEHLPFVDGAFDAALAVFTIHHWRDLARGLDEIARVAARRIFLTWNPGVHHRYWLFEEYLPEIPAAERRLPAEAEITRRFPGCVVEAVPVPGDCTDGFCTAYWRRPEHYLRPEVRAAMSPFARLPREVVHRAMRALEHDLESGEWHRRHGELLGMDELDCGLRLVIAGS